MKHTQEKNLIVIFLIFCLLAFYAVLLFDVEKNTDFPALSGSADLSRWDPQEDGLAVLTGEWAYYRGLLSQDLVSAPQPEYRTVPHFWEEDPDFSQAKGFATYVLTLTGLIPNKIYSMALPDQVLSYTLTVNDSFVAANGKVAKEKSSCIPEWDPQTAVFQADKAGNA